MNRQTLTARWAKLRDTLVRLHRDDRGAEALEKLLIVAVVVLPLLGILIFFRGELSEWVEDNWDQVRDEGVVQDITPGN